VKVFETKDYFTHISGDQREGFGLVRERRPGEGGTIGKAVEIIDVVKSVKVLIELQEPDERKRVDDPAGEMSAGGEADRGEKVRKWRRPLKKKLVSNTKMDCFRIYEDDERAWPLGDESSSARRRGGRKRKRRKTSA